LYFAPSVFDKLRRFTLRQLDEFHGRPHSAHVEENMNVIHHAAHHNPRRAHVSHDGRQVGVHPWSDLIVQQWLAMFGAEDEMGVELGEGLGHGLFLMLNVRMGVNMAFGQSSLHRYQT
jgi:hypothetical protein